MIKLLRVDHRLIHGQVALTWSNALDINCILVANDNVVNNSIQKTTLKLAAPHNVKVVIKNIEDSVESINTGRTDKYKLLIVVQNIKDAYRLVKGIPSLESVNLGGVKEVPGSQPLTHSVFVTEEDREYLKEMIASNTEVYAQQVPTDAKQDIKHLM
ncbi:TPA: PTS sugar transporter subunit IIB [Enterococcus faecium]|nr:PTS sugar transporter subunit IIB [Enterococcus faecium]HAR1784249.1 PTS sugar transporter subunit IIB [Enterococcus faecium]HCR4100833.1 PTS sugar transporter subunit IIB [Enterococcus faecium]